MSPVIKTKSETLLSELIFDELFSETRVNLEPYVVVDKDEINPEIRDVLGCFCEQTGAQFG